MNEDKQEIEINNSEKKKPKRRSYDNKTKDEKIRFHYNRFKRQFKNIDEKKKNIVLPLIDNAAFLTVALEEMQEDMKKNGFTMEYKNGANQFGKKQSVSAAMYNTSLKNLSTITKQLCDLLPKEEEPDDGFDEFVNELE